VGKELIIYSLHSFPFLSSLRINSSPFPCLSVNVRASLFKVQANEGRQHAYKRFSFFHFSGGGEVDGFFINLVIHFVPNMIPKFPISFHCVFNSITFLSHILCLKFYSCNLYKEPKRRHCNISIFNFGTAQNFHIYNKTNSNENKKLNFGSSHKKGKLAHHQSLWQIFLNSSSFWVI